MQFGVVAHPARRKMAWELTKQLGATLFLDSISTPLGAMGNHRRALEWVARLNEPAVILEDDAIPVPGFKAKALQIAAIYPDDVVSLFLGTGTHNYYMNWVVEPAWSDDSPHVAINTLIHAVGVLYPPGGAAKILSNLKMQPEADYAIGEAWYAATGRDIIHLKASLVDHADVQSVNTPERETVPRHARALAI